ncbi:MAG: hypothetical protein R2851_15170 [Caldilineaceae bacterium]
MLAHNGLGICFSNQGPYAEGAPITRRVWRAHVPQATSRGMANALNNLGSITRDGDYVQAHMNMQEAALALETGETLVITPGDADRRAISRRAATTPAGGFWHS